MSQRALRSVTPRPSRVRAGVCGKDPPQERRVIQGEEAADQAARGAAHRDERDARGGDRPASVEATTAVSQ